MQRVVHTSRTEAASVPVWISVVESVFRQSRTAIVLAVLLVVGTAVARAQSDTVKRETIFVSIKIGKREVPREEWSDLVLSTREAITFKARCKVSGSQTDRMLFDVVLQSEEGIRYEKKYSRSGIIRWVEMAPMKYIMTVQAVAPVSLAGPRDSNIWVATPAVIGFRVDDTEAARREQERLAAEAVRKDSTEAPAPSRSVFEWGGYILIGVVILAAVAAIVVQSIRQKRRTELWQPVENSGTDTANIQHTAAKDTTMPNPGPLSYEQLQRENSELRAEIAALRGQIEALQVRTNELQKTNRDLSSQKERLMDHKRQLEELQAQKDELFSMVVHDIKNPAGLIRGLVELLRSYDLTAQEQQEIMEDLMATSSRILSLAQEVSRIVTLESGVMKLDFVRYPVGRIVEDVCRRNQAAAVKKNIEIQRDTSSILPDAEIDVNKMEEVLDNLVSNAIKFSDNGSSIKVKAGKASERVVVEVIDNGPGLTEEDIKRAFGRGARLSAKPTGGESSSGLGLWIVKKIVEAHHGRVWVKSSILKGSTFAFELPMTQPATENDTATVY